MGFDLLAVHHLEVKAKEVANCQHKKTFLSHGRDNKLLICDFSY